MCIRDSNISASIVQGSASIKSDGKGGYIVVPNKVGEELKIGVNARDEEGRNRSMGEYTFRVRQLPDPMPFIEYKDKDGNEVVEDAKGFRTKEYLLKKKMMRAFLGITIKEV